MAYDLANAGVKRRFLPSSLGAGKISLAIALMALEPAHLLTLLGREAIRALASIERGLLHPVPDRLGRGLELPAQLLRRPSLPHQLNEPRPKLWRVRSMALRHRGHSFPPQLWGVHETGGGLTRSSQQRAQTLRMVCSSRAFGEVVRSTQRRSRRGAFD